MRNAKRKTAPASLVTSAALCGAALLQAATSCVKDELHDAITVSVSEYQPILGFPNVGDFHSTETWLYEECLRENIRARVEAYYNNEESRMTEDMKKNRLFTTICLMAATLLTACTQDELAEQGNTLPDGEYPLQIGSVSITAESSEEPWTRVGENEDGSGNDYEGIGAGIGGAGDGEVGTLTIQDATVHTYGGSNSIIHTHRGGGNADYIGWTGSTSGTGGGTNSIQAGADGSITNSTVYCYTGDTLDKTVTYDASSNGTEQSQ